MSVLVDTPVWSLLLRRPRQSGPEVETIRALIQRGEARIIGAVRQEVLSGLRSREQFARVRDHLRAFPNHPLTPAHFEHAAECFNVCRSHGIAGSNTDFLICAVAELEGMQILTTDHDFHLFARYLAITLA